MGKILSTMLVILLLSGCGSAPPVPQRPQAVHQPQSRIPPAIFQNELAASPEAREVVLFALMLLQTSYTFGGKNPSAGLDCSGLVQFAFQEAIGRKVTGNAASMARQGREVTLDQLRAGDLVFFNTLGRPFSHVGIYLGRGGEFIHAPNSKGRVRVEKLTNPYWSKRFEMARTMFEG